MKHGARHAAFLTTALLCACGSGSTPDASGADTALVCHSDAECDDGRFCDGEERCVDGECVLGALVLCEDGVACTTDRCDEARRGCVHEAPDGDGDGHMPVDCGGDDCDDADANLFPGNVEECDAGGHDEDCDPTTFGFRDADGDGYPDQTCCNTAPDGSELCGDDCDDGLPAAHPSEAEVCDGLDSDCDGLIDEGVTATFTRDADANGHGAVGGETRDGCFAPEGFADSADDCDDGEARAHPGAVEVCDRVTPPVDEDCDGVANPPSLCNCDSGDTQPCSLPGVCAAGTQTCVDGAWGDCSIRGSAEVCNGLDDDCDAVIDEGLTVSCFIDSDGDGFAAAGTPSEARCPNPARAFVGGCPRGTTDRAPLGAANLDCDDADAGRVPGASEVCDGVDSDCDGAVDEGAALRCFVDADSDGYGVGSGGDVCPATGTHDCPAGLTANDPSALGLDCDDGDASRSPGSAERCDGADDDCDGMVDEGVKVDCFVDADADGFAAAGASATARCPASPSVPCAANETARAPVNAVSRDCDDGDPTASPSVIEACDGVDNDCDGMIDEGLTVMRYLDADADGFGAGLLVPTCPGEPGFAGRRWRRPRAHRLRR